MYEPLPPFSTVVLTATVMGLAAVLGIVFLVPLLEKLLEWWSGVVGRW